MNHAIELPPLKGTPAQVQWAGRIRTEAAPVVARWLAETEGPDASFLRWGLEQDKAKFWIDVKDVQSKAEFLDLARKIYRQEQAAKPKRTLADLNRQRSYDRWKANRAISGLFY